MTFKQIERTKEFLKIVDSVKGLTETQKLVDEMRGFYGEAFNVNLKIKFYNTINTYSSDYNERDKIALKGFLEGFLAKESNIDIINSILDIIYEGENLRNSEDDRYKYILKIYHSYSGKIKFDKTIELIATVPKEVIRIQGYNITQEMVSGLINKLRLYANELNQVGKTAASIGAKQEINFNPQISVEAKNETNVNVVAIFDNARQQAADLGLPDEQYNAIMDKISELEVLANSKESKGKRWEKVKEFMKWLVGEGIQAASILLPVLAHTIQ